jgi:hypothetical protein
MIIAVSITEVMIILAATGVFPPYPRNVQPVTAIRNTLDIRIATLTVA